MKGGIYWDGNMGVRQVLEIGPSGQIGAQGAAVGRLRYQVLSDCRLGVRVSRFEDAAFRHSTRQSFAAWAKAKITGDEELHDLMESLHAQAIRLRKPVAAQLLAIADQVGEAGAQPAQFAPDSIAADIRGQMEQMGLLDLVRAPSGAPHALIVTSLGRKVIARLTSAERRPDAHADT